MEISSGQWKLGLLMAVTTAVLWGVLPVALVTVMTVLDPITVSFFRFFIAAVVLGGWLLSGNRLPNKRKYLTLSVVPVVIAGLFLTGNYICYIMGLQRTSSEAAQVMIQLAPMLLLLSGVWLFRERFSPVQWLGFLVFASGLVLFFHHRIAAIVGMAGNYGWGIWLLILAALLWTGYGILQKRTLGDFNSEETMLVIYSVGALVFLPLADFSPVGELTPWLWTLLAFCGANTLVAYGCFAEALQHWEASRVSATVALAPLFTVALVQLVPMEGIVVEPLDVLSLLGALLVVTGSITTALANRK